MQMIIWPDGKRPANHMLYADEVMSGFEYSAAAEMVYEGMLKEGFTVVKAAYDRYDGRLRKDLTVADFASWGHSGNPFGDDECGKFYARAMSVWSMLLACQGFIYDGPSGVIGFKPVYRPDDHRSFFTAAEGFGSFSQKRTDNTQTNRIEIRSGSLKINTLVLTLPPEAKDLRVDLRDDHHQVPFTTGLRNGQIRLQLAAPMLLRQDQSLTAEFSWRVP